MKFFISGLILAIVLTVAQIPVSAAEVYTWTDENGVRHFGDQPPADAVDPKPAFKEYTYDEAADRQRTEDDAKDIQKAVNEINKEYAESEQEKIRQAEEAEANQPASMEEKIADERSRLKLKIAELESTPLDQFGSQQNKIRAIGFYRYRLADLEKDPQKYFNEPAPSFEGNFKDSPKK